jgi:hypothetical protein
MPYKPPTPKPLSPKQEQSRWQRYGHAYEKARKALIANPDNAWCRWCLNAFAEVVHHKDHNKQNNNPDNLIPLCKHCHATYHAKNKGKQ